MKQEIYRTVQNRPGIHFRELQRELGCSSSTLNYHLPDLDIEADELNGYRRFYPEEVPDNLKRPLAAMNHEVRGEILYHVMNGADHSDLTEELGVSKSTVSSHLKVLRRDGIVEEEVNGRKKKLSLSSKARKAWKQYASDIIDEASEGFIEMWG